MEGIKMAEETAEEKAAREAKEAEEAKKAEEEAARKAAAEKDAGKGTPPAEGDKDLGEELAGKDVSKFSTAEMLDYIDKLKDENAKRRIANRSLTEAQKKMEKKLADVETRLTDASTKLQTVEEEKKASANAEKTEVERLKTEVEDFKKKLDGLESEKKASDKMVFEKEQRIKKLSRETKINTLLQAANVRFSSDYERQGFMAGLLKTDDDGDFVMNDEAVHYEVGQFVKKTKENNPPPKTPPAGPPGRGGEADIHTRIKALTDKAAKSGLTADDQKELDELLDLAGQAAAYDPRQQEG
jgi:hypothetical protein